MVLLLISLWLPVCFVLPLVANVKVGSDLYKGYLLFEFKFNVEYIDMTYGVFLIMFHVEF